MTEPTREVIVEDDSLVRLDVRAMLEGNGFDVVGEAGAGEAAVELVCSLEPPPNVVVMDVKLDGIDGVEASRRIRSQRPVPIVMLTGYGEDELVASAADAGVYAYLAKPFREADLMTAIRIALVRHGELEDLNAFRRRVEEVDSAKLFPSYMKW
ncbi:MAG: response regulator [Actinobacteria bacterium]|nr:response regulator [Actinomycetota bacterium]